MPRMRSEGTSRRFGQVGARRRLSRAVLYAGAERDVVCECASGGYRDAAEANKPTASQVAAHSPNNRNNTAVIDTLSDQ
jgi:hypothetical protein